ncbi:MAG: DNA replication/repair protein RecF [Bacteroidota bacterium]
MRVRRLFLRDFRNHERSEAEFGGGINALVGDNGQGKTNVLEAISYLCLTKSFYAGADGTVLRLGAEAFRVEGSLVSDAGAETLVAVSYASQERRKEIMLNGIPAESMVGVVGRFPVVILSPEHASVTGGSPAERRRFVDMLLSQVSRAYLAEALEYRRVLRQRNRLLRQLRGRVEGAAATLEPWDDGLARHGARLAARRAAFVREFSPFLLEAYRTFVREGETPSIAYHPVPQGAAEGGVEEFSSCLAAVRGEEVRRGLSLVGPHRDEFRMELSGLNVQAYASQGQHKTFLVALKVAEFFYMKEKTRETPLMLLDDVFSELDEGRTRRILEMFAGLGQTVLTATGEEVFRGAVPWSGENRRHRVAHGTIRPA